ncbi:hypothetical protein MACJ_000436 [Theileria orientalis]|uniref:Uncharacterized protein n=1 Tax=Theileria orientalis TaxID=68886 RepID=A0A976M6B8_THEOR|nr:hypothetical protein MACJ_000436 [Theileria orientalis]
MGRSKFVQVDLKDIYKGDLEVEVDRYKNEVRKITPRNRKLISLVKVGEEIIWKKSGNSRCINLLLFLTSSDKMIVILNTRSDGQKQYVNIVYDPTVSEGEETSFIESRGKRTTYIGLLPLIIEMNEELGSMEKYRNEIFGVELNIKDKFDGWYYKHTMSSYIAHSRKSKPVLNYATYEPNEMELFVKITDNHRSIWLANPSRENRMNFCKKVEVYLKHTSLKLMRLTLVEGQQVYYKYNFISSRWVVTDKKQFVEMIRYLGFNEVLNSNQERIESGLPIGSEGEGMDDRRANPDKSEANKTGNVYVNVDVGVPSVEDKDTDERAATGVSVAEEQRDKEPDTKSEVPTHEWDTKPEVPTHEAGIKAGESMDKKKEDDESEEEEITIPSLNIWDISEEDFYFIKRKMSLLRIITMVPKRKIKVEKLYFNDYSYRYINSYDFKIDFIKWKNTFHITETMVKYNDRKNYFTHYLDKERGEVVWKTYTQDEFYRKIIDEIKYFDSDNVVRCHHFALLDDISEIAEEPNYKKLINII